MDWWVWVPVAALLLGAYAAWLAARVGRLHRRAQSAATALDAALVRRAAAAALLADDLASADPTRAGALYAAARAALDADPGEREAAENDLTQLLRGLPPVTGAGGSVPAGQPGPAAAVAAAPSWPGVVTASRRAGLARQVHTDLVRDALAIRRRLPVRVLGLARRHSEPAYLEVGDPGLEAGAARPGGNGARPARPAGEVIR